MTALPRNVRDWPAEARHDLVERIGIMCGHGLPLTGAEGRRVQAEAEECVRVVWRCNRVPMGAEEGA
jgi:hypothetical protein